MEQLEAGMVVVVAGAVAVTVTVFAGVEEVVGEPQRFSTLGAGVAAARTERAARTATVRENMFGSLQRKASKGSERSWCVW